MDRLTIKPLTPVVWKDFEKLFGPKGACAGCWCMFWRLKRKIYNEGKGTGNKRKMKNLVERGSTTGLLAFIGNEPAGWCSLGPREDFPVLENSKILARPDEKPVWSIVCFFIEKKFRRQGLSGQFLGQIMQYAKKSGAKILEGYPIATDNDNYPATFAYTGFYSSFIKSGFVEVARRSPTRPIMRYNL